MPVVGTNFLEMNFVRNELDVKDAKDVVIRDAVRNVNITEIKQKDLVLDKDSEILSFIFNYDVTYPTEKPKDKNLGKIFLAGEVLFMDKRESTKKILGQWKKEKKIDREVMGQIIFAAINVCNLEAMYNSSKVLLPYPFKMDLQVGPKE